MAKDRLVKIHPRGVFASPPRADILFGHLCVRLAMTGGAAAVEKLIGLAGEGKFRLSDPFPEGFLPVPLDDPGRFAERRAALLETFRKKLDASAAGCGRRPGKLEADIEWAGILKKARKIAFVSKKRWKAGISRADALEGRVAGSWAPGDTIPPLPMPWDSRPGGGTAAAMPVRTASLHTAVNRLTGGAMEGTLHERQGVFYPPETVLDMYIRCPDDMIRDILIALAGIGADGYLRYASSGWGRFTVGEQAETRLPDARPEDGRSVRWMSLCPCAPEDGWQGTARYGLLSHYGRLWMPTGGESPFKRPLILMAAGATFESDGPPKGRLLRNVHESRKEAVHYAFVYPVSC
ncbi:MAG: hypothetical protein N3A38_09725 [Planctomycetota bacterium]|nr:hypothetical protein [Planctomycetota bacterium]